MSGIPFTKSHLIQLKGFVDLCRKNPNLLHNEDLQFFKDYIESFGGKIPDAKPTDEVPKAEFEPKAEPESEPEPPVESEESDIELDNTGVIGMLDKYVLIYFSKFTCEALVKICKLGTLPQDN